MIAQAVRIHTAWLKNVTHGVNAQLARLVTESLLDGDPVPPDVVFIGDQFDDRVVSKWADPPSKPALYVSEDLPESFAQVDQRPGQTRGIVPVGIRYFTAHQDPDRAMRDTSHTLRAIWRSLNVLFANAQQAARARAGIYVEGYETIHMGELIETVGNSQVTGGVVVRCRVVDTKP